MLAIISIVIVTASPVILLIAFFKISSISLETHQSKIGTIYNDLRILNNDQVSRVPLMYYPIFMLRRLIIVLLATLMPNWPFAQIQLTLLTTILTIIYLVLYMPFREPKMN